MNKIKKSSAIVYHAKNDPCRLFYLRQVSRSHPIGQKLAFFILLILSLFTSSIQSGYAQLPVSKQEAFELVRKNNHKLKAEQAKVAMSSQMVKSAYNISPIDVNMEAGQFNSIFFDTRFGLGQSFSLPSVYSKRKSWLLQEGILSQFRLADTEIEIRKNIDFIFNQYAFLLEKEKLLISNDSLYASFLRKATARLMAGESNILEKTTAENQKFSIDWQLKEVRNDISVIIREFNFLLNDSVQYMPQMETYDLLKYNVFYDSASLYRHPKIRLAVQDVQVAKAITSLQKTALYPDFKIAYNNISIRGIGADDKLYNASNRFSSVQVGLSIPIFRSAVQASIEASKINEEIKTSVLKNEYAQLTSSIDQYYMTYNQRLSEIDYYRNTALKNASLIRSTAGQQFLKGEINYLEFVMLVNQSVMIESDYLDKVKSANDIIIALHYLTSNN